MGPKTTKKLKSDQTSEFSRMRTEHLDDEGVAGDDNPRACAPETFTPEQFAAYERADDLDSFLAKFPDLDLRPKKEAPAAVTAPHA